MSETRYQVEWDKSGRANCKKCKAKIAKGELRITTVVPETESTPYAMKSHQHPRCVGLPRKYATGATKISVTEFVDTVLEDVTEQQDILPAKAEELVEAIATSKSKPDGDGTAATKKAGDAGKSDNLMQLIKEAFQARASTTSEQQQQHEGKEPSPKKAKTDPDAVIPATEPNGVDSRSVDAYATFYKYKNDQIKDLLKWNRQHVTGNKDALLLRVIDGAVHGRLDRCPLDGGRLKLSDDGVVVTCSGSFDESTMTRLDCSYKKPAVEAPRSEWFTEKPTKEQEEEMDRLVEVAKGGGPAEGAGEAEIYLKKAVKELEWNLGSRPGLKAAAQGLADILMNQPDDATKLATPDDEKELLKKVGAFISANKEKSAEELVPHLIEHFGLKQAKEKKAAAKQEAVGKQVHCEANGALVSAFQELMELYAKEKNNNAASTYRKVVAAVSELDFAITEENAKGLCKGKTKVPNIGKSTVDKIVEFLETGTMAKLEEKRAEAA